MSGHYPRLMAYRVLRVTKRVVLLDVELWSIRSWSGSDTAHSVLEAILLTTDTGIKRRSAVRPQRRKQHAREIMRMLSLAVGVTTREKNDRTV
ncbi:hypothetical protein EVAR_28258_1 [Eumeta japonica]|uniref:Uncharacterized protein n=1 Tax=Eumeta variegata TaxID=151549 RepID=A0A4C1V7Y4_EUMVA|nr:hypothetical protein EVAR_28258_1 [Eumeta japonica]